MSAHRSIFYLILLAAAFGYSLFAQAKPQPPVDALALTVQEQEALRAVAVPTPSTFLAVSPSESPPVLVWQGDPLPLSLPLQHEQRLQFTEPVQVDINGQLTNAQLRVINDHQNVYLTALTEFEKKTRIYVTLKKSGQIIFFDLNTISALPKSSAQVIQVKISPRLLSKTLPVESGAQSIAEKTEEEIKEAKNSLSSEWMPTPSTLTDALVQGVRFAWQKLYAPAYLQPENDRFLRTPMHTQSWVSGLWYRDAVEAHPLASWSDTDLTITAIELRNPFPHSVSLDVTRDLCGHWRAAVLYPRTTLAPAGHAGLDRTTLFLISTEPFKQAVGVCHGGL